VLFFSFGVKLYYGPRAGPENNFLFWINGPRGLLLAPGRAGCKSHLYCNPFWVFGKIILNGHDDMDLFLVSLNENQLFNRRISVLIQIKFVHFQAANGR